MKIGESFSGIVSAPDSYCELDEDCYDPVMYAEVLLARHTAPEVAAEEIIDAYEAGLLTWQDATMVARELGV